MSRGRYAPSPTGNLHLGNARTALVAWLRARSTNSSFVMRVEDIDAPRTVPEAVSGNLTELRWLGLDWDEGPDLGGPFAPYLQSERSESYRAALKRLQGQGKVFECYLSRRELRELSSAPHGATAVYGERERRINEQLTNSKQTQGKQPSLRLRAWVGRVSFDDLLHGHHEFDLERDVGDVVLKRADDAWAYALAVVVDDAAMGIEEVVRGDDLLAATGTQLMLYRALKLNPPRFLHVPLLLDEGGERMAKRRGALTLSELMAAGVSPQRVVGLLAFSLGLLPQPVPCTPRSLLDAYKTELLSKEPYRLQQEDLNWLRK